MKKLSLLILLTWSLAAVGGCGDGFPDEEMHLGVENKTRPYAVVIDPPEAAPGDTVLVTLRAQAADPDELDVSWRVALDYTIGLYDDDKSEGHFLDLDVPLPEYDDEGFLTQQFFWVVPDSVMLISTALPEVLTDPVMVMLAAELIGPEAGNPPTKAAVDTWLKNLTADEVQAMPPAERYATWALADLFACQVRFRTAMWSDQMVDVTRNLTIRQTSRLGGPNENSNAETSLLLVTALHKADADLDDLEDPSVERSEFIFIENGVRQNDQLEVPLNSGWTYYLTVDFFKEQYTSPYDPSLTLSEQGEYRWYYYRQDQPASGHQFLVNEDGDGAEMWELDEEVRLNPGGVGSRFRVLSVVRDDRSEWRLYHAVPGCDVQEGIIEFVNPVE